MDAVAGRLTATNPPYELTIEEIPLLGQLYPYLGYETAKDAFVPYPSPATRTPLDNVAMYLHSSGQFGFDLLCYQELTRRSLGSTGFPKCIPETHRTLIHYAALGQYSLPFTSSLY